MPNLRIIYDNAADRATLTTTTTLASGLGLDNLLSDTKSRVCRSAGTSLSISAAFPTAETIGGVALPFTNLSPTATIQVKLFNSLSVVNLLRYSQDFNNSAWTISSVVGGGVITANNAVAPDGTLTADTLTGTYSSSSVTPNGLIYQTFTGTAASSHTFSVYLRVASGTNSARFQIKGTSTQTTGAQIDITTTWQRFSLTFAFALTGTVTAGLNTIGNSTPIQMWGFQAEAGSTMTSYVATGAVPGPRPIYDSGVVFACPAASNKLHGWTAAAAASAYAYGGGTYARFWFTPTSASYLTVDISDPANLQGYVEASRLVAGNYWEPEIGAVEGSTMTVGDTSKHYRTDAGDQYTDRGTRFRKQSISLPSLNEVDRAALWNILWGNGMAVPVFISLFPSNADTRLEQANEIYGKLQVTPVMNTPYFNRNSATLEIEEV